jgi:hypothetical protein
MEGYRGLAASIILNALGNYSCKGASCEKVTTASGRKYPAVRRAICMNCQRDAETFLYSDWCHTLLDLLNLNQDLLIQAMDNPGKIGGKLHGQGKRQEAKHSPQSPRVREPGESARHPAPDVI